MVLSFTRPEVGGVFINADAMVIAELPTASMETSGKCRNEKDFVRAPLMPPPPPLLRGGMDSSCLKALRNAVMLSLVTSSSATSACSALEWS
jgi:hypothetical protein